MLCILQISLHEVLKKFGPNLIIQKPVGTIMINGIVVKGVISKAFWNLNWKEAKMLRKERNVDNSFKKVVDILQFYLIPVCLIY